MKIFTIYDRATEVFNQPFFQKTEQAAMRIIKNEMRQDNSMLGAHPTDYELWCIGSFNEQEGVLTPDRRKITRLEDLRETPQQ